MKKLIFFLIPLLSYGQCDIEILGFDPISTDIMMVVNGGACCTESDSIGEFILALGFNPPQDESPWPCFGDQDWMLLLYPLDFPGFEIGQGPDNIYQAGDTIAFNIVEDTPLAGSGTLQCWEQALEEGIFMQDCMVITIWQINDSETLDGSSAGIAGCDYPDENITNSWLEFSMEANCGPPPPPVPNEPQPWEPVETTDTTDTSGPPPPEPPNVDDCKDPCIYVSNVFTPNGDYVNDTWRPVTKPDCWWRWECKVYNRWGAVVWESYDPRDKWMGEGGLSYVPDGVYLWTIRGTTYRSTKVVSMQGHITVFR